MSLILLNLDKSGLSRNNHSNANKVAKGDVGMAVVPDKFLLRCRSCAYAQLIPSDYSVDVDEVTVKGKYLSQLALTVEIKEFFLVTPVPDLRTRGHRQFDLKQLHIHMLSHCDPLFLMLSDSEDFSAFKYKSHAEENDYAQFSGEGNHGLGAHKIVGNGPNILLMFLWD
jgi:hypothetical protein